MFEFDEPITIQDGESWNIEMQFGIDEVPSFIVHREFKGGMERLKAINEGRDLNEMFYQMPVLVPCPECKGKGEILLFTQTHKCEKCDGKGKVTAAEAKDSES